MSCSWILGFVVLVGLIGLSVSQPQVITGCDGWKFNWNSPINENNLLMEGAIVGGTITPPTGTIINDYVGFLGPLRLGNIPNNSTERFNINGTVLTASNSFIDYTPTRFQRAVYYVACAQNDPFKYNVTTAVERCFSKQPLCLWIFNYTLTNYPPKVINGLDGYKLSNGQVFQSEELSNFLSVKSQNPNPGFVGEFPLIYVFDTSSTIMAYRYNEYDLPKTEIFNQTTKGVTNRTCIVTVSQTNVVSPTGVTGNIFSVNCTGPFVFTAFIDRSGLFFVDLLDAGLGKESVSFVLPICTISALPQLLDFNPSQLRTAGFVFALTSNEDGATVSIDHGDGSTPSVCAVRHYQGMRYKVRCPPHTYPNTGSFLTTIVARNFFARDQATLPVGMDPLSPVTVHAISYRVVKSLTNDVIHRGNIGSVVLYPISPYNCATCSISLTIDWGDSSTPDVINAPTADNGNGILVQHAYPVATAFKRYFALGIYSITDSNGVVTTFTNAIAFIVRIHPFVQMPSVKVPEYISFSDVLDVPPFYYYDKTNVVTSVVAVFGPRAVVCTRLTNGGTGRVTVTCPFMPAALMGHTPFSVYLSAGTAGVVDTFQRNVRVTGPSVCGELTVPNQAIEGESIFFTFQPNAAVIRSSPRYNLTINWGDGQQTASSLESGQYRTLHTYSGYFDTQRISVDIDFPTSQFTSAYYDATTQAAMNGSIPFWLPDNGYYLDGFYYAVNELNQLYNYYYFSSLVSKDYYNQQTYFTNYDVTPRIPYQNSKRCSMPLPIRRINILNSPPIFEPLSTIVSGQLGFKTDFVPPVLTVYDKGFGDTHTVLMSIHLGAQSQTYFCTPLEPQAGSGRWNIECPTIVLDFLGVNAVSFNVTDNNGAQDYISGYLNVFQQ